jgi:hypothetical protein
MGRSVGNSLRQVKGGALALAESGKIHYIPIIVGLLV